MVWWADVGWISDISSIILLNKVGEKIRKKKKNQTTQHSWMKIKTVLKRKKKRSCMEGKENPVPPVVMHPTSPADVST